MKNQSIYIVETPKEVFFSSEKIDAIYKHVEFRRGQARYKEVLASRFNFPKGKEKIPLRSGILEEVL
jgi:hypothetical protein